jgi:predicted Zn-dependent protease
MLVSEEQEITMGRQLYPNALWGGEGGGGEYKDPSLRAYLKNIVVNIQRVSHRPNLPVDFVIQNSSVTECLGNSRPRCYDERASGGNRQ